uniref:Uncharacterized protein n=1 Tax=Rhizophora mucronata TaxID=61149 RepID=A0A2P2PEL4_RHIMU
MDTREASLLPLAKSSLMHSLM